MKLVYQDLIKFLSTKPSKDLLSKKLFQLGHEHEINGEIFDMELTPNRGDCLSLAGLARDLKVFFGSTDTLNLYEDNIEPLDINFVNFSPKDCPKISFLEIEIGEVSTKYKSYLESYFHNIGGNKTNLFTDISNYISYELGQPTHCYDRNTIHGDIIFEKKDCNNTFKTLLGSEVALKGNNCIFAVNDEIVSLAGIMGGASTACSLNTKKVLIECAYFNPESIIGKSIKYNLDSDAAHKFERGVDIESQEKVLRRFAKVVSDHAEIKTIKFKTFSSIDHHSLYISENVNKVNKILGTTISRNEYLNYLGELGFEISNKIKIPSHRHDIKNDNDLAEEVARIIGYDNIISTPIKIKKIASHETKNANHYNYIGKIETLLTKHGFSEIINSPFTSKVSKASIKIDNPLDSSRNNFRTSLRESLINNLLYNERRQKDSIKLFEISDIYTKDTEVFQQKKLGIIVSGRLGHNYKDFSKKLDYDYLNNLLNGSLDKHVFEITEIPRNELNTKKKDKIFYVEISIDDIPSNFYSDINLNEKNINFIDYKPISDYPSSTRDFSFSIDDLSQVKKIINILDEVSDDIIKNSYIFDFYKNEKTKTVKLGYRFIFQSHVKTLSDVEINDKVQNILGPILQMEGVSIPGM